ncbi:MAG: alginate export family protein, partial [Acidithiobacillus sp.]
MPKRAQKQSHIRKTRFLQAALLSLWAGSVAADPLLGAITGGQVSLQMRPRYEFMQQAGKEDANAFTLRTLLGFSSKPLYGISADLQFINVAGIVNDYNSL